VKLPAIPGRGRDACRQIITRNQHGIQWRGNSADGCQDIQQYQGSCDQQDPVQATQLPWRAPGLLPACNHVLVGLLVGAAPVGVIPG